MKSWDGVVSIISDAEVSEFYLAQNILFYICIAKAGDKIGSH